MASRHESSRRWLPSLEKRLTERERRGARALSVCVRAWVAAAVEGSGDVVGRVGRGRVQERERVQKGGRVQE